MGVVRLVYGRSGSGMKAYCGWYVGTLGLIESVVGLVYGRSGDWFMGVVGIGLWALWVRYEGVLWLVCGHIGFD